MQIIDFAYISGMISMLPLIYAFQRNVNYSRDGVAFNVSLKEFIVTINKVSLI